MLGPVEGRLTGLRAAARHVGAATLAGVITGVLVGGLLGRIVMRVAGFTAGPGMVGAFTSNGNRVGDITLEGTAVIVVFVGLEGWRAAVDRRAQPGLQRAQFGGAPAYVMPSTSGRNAHVQLAGLRDHTAAALALLDEG